MSSNIPYYALQACGYALAAAGLVDGVYGLITQNTFLEYFSPQWYVPKSFAVDVMFMFGGAMAVNLSGHLRPRKDLSIVINELHREINNRGKPDAPVIDMKPYLTGEKQVNK